MSVQAELQLVRRGRPATVNGSETRRPRFRCGGLSGGTFDLYGTAHKKRRIGHRRLAPRDAGRKITSHQADQSSAAQFGYSRPSSIRDLVDVSSTVAFLTLSCINAFICATGSAPNSRPTGTIRSHARNSSSSLIGPGGICSIRSASR